jgi:hypothetical protein
MNTVHVNDVCADELDYFIGTVSAGFSLSSYYENVPKIKENWHTRSPHECGYKSYNIC